MFGIPSSPKLLLILLIVGLVLWYFRRQPPSQRENTGDSAGAARAKPAGRKAEPAEKARPVEDMLPCPKCGAYVAKNAGHVCTKADAGR